MIPSDPLFSLQRQFEKTGDFRAIWPEFTGAGIAIALYDDGVQYQHEELAANYDASRHFTHDGITYDGQNTSETARHGTAVAGIVAATQGNDAGGVGVAWDATLTSVPIIGGGALDRAGFDVTLAAYRHGATFDIMSNSWGWPSSFDASYNALSGGWMTETVAAIADVAAEGRGGLGTVIVQAAGNDSANANGTGIDAARHTITVAATDWQGYKASYSNHGANLLVAAPIAQRTTDLEGHAGYTATGYTPLGGTSAATPFVSGVAALMLEANPGLGWRDVQAILALSARDTGSGFGAPKAGDEVAAWQGNGAGIWNGGALSFSLDYGFGIVDAYAAVRMAEAWTHLHATAGTSEAEVLHSVSLAGPARAIGANARHEVALAVAPEDNLAIEHVTVDIVYDVEDLGDLALDLISPAGASLRIFDGDGHGAGQDAGAWSFGVTGFLGAHAAGEWRLAVTNAGTAPLEIADVDLHFRGRPDTGADVHHFTDSFADLVALEPARGQLDAPEDAARPGAQALNFAALPGDLFVDLPGGAVTELGTPLSLGAPGRVGTVVTGDGADVLLGADGDEALHGMRGGDGLSGGAGDDRLDGGAGDDRLGGGTGDDALIGGAGNDALHGDDALAAGWQYGIAAPTGPGVLHVAGPNIAAEAQPLAIDAAFHIAPDPEIAGSDASHTLSVTYDSSAPRGPVFLSLTILQPVTMVLDVDHARVLDGWVQIAEAGGPLLQGVNDVRDLDAGTTTTRDPYLETALAPGDYVIGLGQFWKTSLPLTGLPQGSSGTRQISLIGEGLTQSFIDGGRAGADR